LGKFIGERTLELQELGKRGKRKALEAHLALAERDGRSNETMRDDALITNEKGWDKGNVD